MLRNTRKFIRSTWLNLRWDTRTRYAAVYIRWLHVLITWKEWCKIMICSGIISKLFSHNYLFRAARDGFFTNLTLITSKQSSRFIGYGAVSYLTYLCLFWSPHDLCQRHVHLHIYPLIVCRRNCSNSSWKEVQASKIKYFSARERFIFQNPLSCLAASHSVGRCWQPQKVNCVWNVMTHALKPDFVFRRNGRVHLKRRGRQFSRLLAAEVWASAVVMLDTPCSEVVWRVLATHSIRQFPLQFPYRASPCAITFQLEFTSPLLRYSRLF